MKPMMSYWVLGNLAPLADSGQYPDLAENEQRLRRWTSWSKTPGGPIVGQDCHGIGTINWFAGDVHSTSAVGHGGLRFPVPYGDWNTGHRGVIDQYPAGPEGWLISIEHTAGYRDVKEQFFRAKGVLETSRSYVNLHGMTPGESYDMTRTAVESTLKAILWRMAIEPKREVGWDEMMPSA